jgi:protein SCO1/2
MTSPPNLEQPRRRLTSGIIPALAVAGIAGLVSLLVVGRLREDGVAARPPEGCILEGAELIGGPISLQDARNQTVTQADFAGEPAVVYFGFTHCPDVCPTTMYQLAEALKLPGGHDVQPILISVDPERDTPDVLNTYVHTDGFPDGLQGLTGSEAQVQAAAEAFKVVRQRAPIDGAPADVYNVDHTSFLYVMDGNWQTRAVLPTQGRSPADIAACIDAGLAGA